MIETCCAGLRLSNSTGNPVAYGCSGVRPTCAKRHVSASNSIGASIRFGRVVVVEVDDDVVGTVVSVDDVGAAMTGTRADIDEVLVSSDVPHPVVIPASTNKKIDMRGITKAYELLERVSS